MMELSSADFTEWTIQEVADMILDNDCDGVSCFGLRVVEMPFYEDLDYDTMVVEVAEDSGIESIIEDVPKPV